MNEIKEFLKMVNEGKINDKQMKEAMRNVDEYLKDKKDWYKGDK